MSTLVAQTISNGTVSTSTANCIQGSAKAWVNFDGANGTIRASYNTSSITRNSTGFYTVNFTNALPDANYAAVIATSTTSGSAFTNAQPFTNGSYLPVAPTTSNYQFACINLSANYADPAYCCASVFD